MNDLEATALVRMLPDAGDENFWPIFEQVMAELRDLHAYFN